MFSFKGLVNKIFKRKAQDQLEPKQVRSSQPLTGKKFFERAGKTTLTIDRGGKHAGGKQRPKNWKAKAKIRRKMAARSRVINRKMQ
jgi:hypothetical protein